jgi:methylmalonyl-CoA mutase N-terminal domain/subunit
VLGGTQSLHCNAYDEALALPTEKAARIALRTQQILAHESGVAHTVDPLGGSYAVERLTRDIEGAAEDYIRRIDEQGGAVHAIAFMQREIQEVAYRWQRDVEEKRRIVVGVNEFVTEDEPPAALFAVDSGVSEALAERVARVRKTRDADRTRRALDALEAAARGRANLLPLLVEAVEQAATLGEICERLRAVFGVHQPSVTF